MWEGARSIVRKDEVDWTNPLQSKTSQRTFRGPFKRTTWHLAHRATAAVAPRLSGFILGESRAAVQDYIIQTPPCLLSTMMPSRR